MDIAGKKVLVTGADGFIGSHVVQALAAAGAQVTGLALYNSFDQSGWLDEVVASGVDVDVVRGDVRDPHFVRGLVAGHEVVLHLAALIAIPYSYVAPQSYVETNVTGTVNVFEAARAAGVKRIVHTSTSEVYGTALVEPISEEHPYQAQSPYSASKLGGDLMAEAYARSFDLPVVTLRPFNTFGPRQSERAVIPTVIRQALDPNADAIRLGDLSPRRDFVFVADTAQAFVAAATGEGFAYGQPYNAGTGRAVTIGDVVEAVRRITGTDKPVIQESGRFRPSQSEVRALIADYDRLHKVTGWQPRVSLEEGLARTVEWWRSRFADRRVRSSRDYMV